METKLSAFRQSAILAVMTNVEEKIRANGVPAVEMSRYWAMLAHFQGLMGDDAAKAMAVQKALEFNPNQPWAKQMQAEL